MGKKKKKGDEKCIARIVLITAVLNLIEVIVDLIHSLIK